MARMFFWIKTPVGFHLTREMKRLIHRPNGWALFGIYIVLLLLTANSDGIWVPDDLSDSIAEELAMMVDCGAEPMQELLDLLQRLKLLQMGDDGDLIFCQVHDMVGCETDSAERTRKSRERKKAADAQAEFVPPSIEEVQEYCAQNGILIGVQRFMDYYESNGWKVGMNPMQDWHAAVRNWAARDAKLRTEAKHTPESTGDRLAKMTREGTLYDPA